MFVSKNPFHLLPWISATVFIIVRSSPFLQAKTSSSITTGTSLGRRLRERSRTYKKRRYEVKKNGCKGKKCVLDLLQVNVDDAEEVLVPLFGLNGTVTVVAFKNSGGNSTREHWNGENGFSYVNLLMQGKGPNGNDLWFGNFFDSDHNRYYDISPDATGTSIVATTIEGSEFLEEIVVPIPPEEANNNRSMITTYTSVPDEHNTANRGLQLADGSVIDIMFVWTMFAECTLSGLKSNCPLTDQTETNMRGRLNAVIAETNTMYRHSGILTQLRIVYAYRHPTYVERNCYTSISDLMGTTDGSMDDVHIYRGQYGADMVQLYTGPCGICGAAPMGPSKDLMFSVININCLQLTPAHEMGHTMGCDHDRGTSNRCDADGYYNFGYRNAIAGFRDIMSYDCDSCACNYNCGDKRCPRVARMANTAMLYNGYAIGDASNNCAQTINDNRVVIASYYDSIVNKKKVGSYASNDSRFHT